MKKRKEEAGWGCTLADIDDINNSFDVCIMTELKTIDLGRLFTLRVETIILKKIGGHESFLWGHWYHCFGLLVTSSRGGGRWGRRGGGRGATYFSVKCSWRLHENEENFTGAGEWRPKCYSVDPPLINFRLESNSNALSILILTYVFAYWMELDKTFRNRTQSSASGCWDGGLGSAFLNTLCFYTKHIQP